MVVKSITFLEFATTHQESIFWCFVISTVAVTLAHVALGAVIRLFKGAL